MKKIKVRTKKEKKVKNKMSLNMEELLEFENALKTVKEYESKIDIPIVKTKTFQRVMNSISESKKQKKDVELSERIEKLEKSISKIVNSDYIMQVVNAEKEKNNK